MPNLKEDLNRVYSPHPSIVTRKTGNEYVLVPVTNNIADMNSVYTLNETGAFLWELIDGKRSLADLVSALTEEYHTDAETASRDVLDFIGEMDRFLIVK